ncbi:DNA ligase [Marinomonas fungiae]|uniref:ATP dependent DNA ligase domain/DNA ligase OB-like domain n=1 Tax=Marinomonas fungiae TaxID=1137284 RepID=A0A0K6ILJ6_9GAMM|nr:DNA ligase [Marinomonas fungiae]CUB03985.1 ATP dependent DNA ligase domain/DNA ligase OB-like domain [Marinomonas fungiae]
MRIMVSTAVSTALLIASLVSQAQSVQLATVYADENVSDYLVSEKLDGIRAIWDGQQLTTRQGNPISAPVWFTDGWPEVWLDGELWAGRGRFGFVQNTVLDSEPNEMQWREIQYMVFDAPNYTDVFEQRAASYLTLIRQTNNIFIKGIEQLRLEGSEALYRLLDDVTNAGGEGLMLHRKDALLKDGRSDALLKLKPFQDAEAKVIGHAVGSGKYKGMMGALLVELANGRQFKIGTGFSDLERSNPPQVGEYITFRYQGLTSSGLPRFASFVRVRKGPFEFREPEK